MVPATRHAGPTPPMLEGPRFTHRVAAILLLILMSDNEYYVNSLSICFIIGPWTMAQSAYK
jgi:hypothetical protein